MKERPILFNGAMVRAVIGGSKMQTRRLVKPQPGTQMEEVLRNNRGEWPCPLGQVGDRLWVRETWAQDSEDGQLCYRADIGTGNDADDWERNRIEGAPGYRWRPSIHMPRRASRIMLEVTSVQVERLQEISEADALKEGCRAGTWEYDNGEGTESARESFECLWDSIYQNWDKNPWVWVVEFKRA